MASDRPIPIISVFTGLDPDWKWYAEDTIGKAHWDFHTEEPKTLLERKIRRPRLSRVMGAFRCVLSARRLSSSAVAAGSQYNTMWAAIALRVLAVRTPLLSFSFHFPRLPKGLRLLILKWALSRVERFAVHSEAERERYAKHFGLSVERFQLLLWGVQPSSVQIEDLPPPISSPYICALGKDGRDYRTLFEAMKRLPELTLIAVVQPYNLTGIDIPRNVKVYCDIPRIEAMNILKHSQFMVLPLESDETSCGHITLVSAMFCKKAIVATSSSGIADYFPAGYDAPKIAAGDVTGWVEALGAMAGDHDRLERCAVAGDKFAHEYCSHDASCSATMDVFRKAGIVIV
jgi:glycosyltransferase involved in cell wall biosynthesis